MRFLKAISAFIGCFIILLFYCFNPDKLYAVTVFQDNFNDGDFSNWDVVTDPDRAPCSDQWTIKDGMLGININQSSCTTNIVPNDLIWNNLGNNYTIELDMKFVQGTDHNIAFRFSPGITKNYWYDIHFVSPNSYELERVPFGSPGTGVHYPLPNKSDFYHLKIIMKTGNIQVYIDNNLTLNYVYDPSLDKFPTGKLALRAGTGSNPVSETYFDNIVVTSIDDTPVGNVPVVFLPGMGGSWNTSAIITGNDSNNWKKTPFIKVYENLRDTFLSNGYTEGDDYFEFYYDWRDSPDEIADNLKDYIENTVLNGKDPDTKINIASHSMGGLVARAFAQKYGDSKINKLVTAGSPHQGSIPAWYGWSGAEIGDRWSWEWITLQLYLQIHKDNYTSPVSAIHTLSPSLQELQPSFDFATDSQDQVIGVSSMSDFNNYLLNLNTNLEDSLKSLITTIAGVNNSDSIEWIKLKDRSLTDRLLSKWPDGKPDTYELTDEGDLTVLQKSALIDNTTQAQVSNTHHGMVQSDAGIQAILDGLDLDINPVTNTDIPNRNPSLVFFLHSPADIRVTAPGGSQAGHDVDSPMGNAIYSPEDKLLVIYDAIDGDYEVEVVGNASGSYSLELGQLTQTGEKWNTTQETINNGEIDTYTLSFGADNPKDFPLTDETGKMQLNLAKNKLNKLSEYISSQSFSTAYKRQLTRKISQIIRMIDRAIVYVDANNHAKAYRYARAVMTGCYSLRMKIDQLGRGGRIGDEVRAKLKSMAHDAGLVSMEAYIATLNQTSRAPNQTRVSREISTADKVITRAGNRIALTSGENHALGLAFSLSQEMLAGSQSAFDSGEYSRASAQALLSRLLSLEATKIR